MLDSKSLTLIFAKVIKISNCLRIMFCCLCKTNIHIAQKCNSFFSLIQACNMINEREKKTPDLFLKIYFKLAQISTIV